MKQTKNTNEKMKHSLFQELEFLLRELYQERENIQYHFIPNNHQFIKSLLQVYIYIYIIYIESKYYYNTTRL